MGDPLSFAASLLGIASFGISMVTTLSTFTLSYTSASEKISSLSADISVTSSILTSLGNTIQEYEAEFHFKIDNFQNAKAACEKNFDNLGNAIKAVKRDKIKDVIGKKIWRGVAEVGLWEKLKFALGGEQSLKDLVVSIETSKSTLQLLLDSVNLLILKRLSKKQLLNENQADDLKLLVHHLPVLLKSIQQAGLMPLSAIPEETKGVIQVVEVTHLDPKPIKLEEAALPALTKGFDTPTNISANIHEDVSKQDFHNKDIHPPDPPNTIYDFTAPESKRLDIKPLPGMSERRISPTKDLMASPSLVAPKGISLPLNANVHEIDNEYQDNPAEDGIVPPVTEPDPSYDSPPRPPPLFRSLRHITSPLPARHRTSSLYEGWLLEPFRNRAEPALILFCGIKLHFYPPADSPHYQRTPFSLDNEMLKKRAELVNTKFKEVSKQRGEIPNTIELEIATLPANVKSAIDALLEHRNRAATRGYGWKVFSIETLSKTSRKSLFTRKSTSPSPPSWLIILRGGEATNFEKEHATNSALPTLHSNPWAFHRGGGAAVHLRPVVDTQNRTAYGRDANESRLPARPAKGSDYYDDDELDIRVRRGRESPETPVVYPEQRYRPAPRPYYESPSTYLVPTLNNGHARSRSSIERGEAAPAPVIINNRIYNDYEDDDYIRSILPHRERYRERSRLRPHPSPFTARGEYELEKTRRELEAYKLVNIREDYELERTRKELELLRREKEREEDEKRYKNKRELEAYKLIDTHEDHGSFIATLAGAASAMKPSSPPGKSYHQANDLSRPHSRGSSFSDASYQDLPLDSSAKPEIAREREASVDVEMLMDQFLKTFVEDSEGGNE